MKLILFTSILLFGSLSWANFYDVPSNDPYKDAVDYVQAQGLVEGYEDGTYRPSQTINRAEFLKIVLEARFPNTTSCNTSFNYPDVEINGWYRNYVQKASCLNLVQGYPDGTFGPGNTITYAEVAKIVSEAYSLPVTTGGLWYSGYLQALETQSAVPRSSISAGDLLTRGEMAHIIYALAPSSNSSVEADSNVLLVILDDVGFDYFPGYLENESFEKAPMPNIEKLMQSSYVFNNLHTYSMCSPTRASLLTGLHGVDNGVLDPGRTSYLDPKFQSIQQALKNFNPKLATGVFGKWHVIGSQTDELDHPNKFGIDEYAGFMSGSHESYFNWDKVENQTKVKSNVYSTTDFTNDAIDFIAKQNNPWFTWVAYTAPHTPIHLPPAELHSFDELSGDERDLKRNKDEYLKAMLESVDTEIGRLLESMNSQTRAKTWVVVMGDNGTGSQVAQEPYKSVGAKGTLQVGGINTPLVVFNPYQNGQGQRVDDLVSTIDFYPTITEIMTGQAVNNKGRSFYPLIGGNASTYTGHNAVFSQHLSAVAARSQNYKLIDHDEDGEKFYDLSADAFEQNNLIGNLNSTQAEAYTQLKTALDEYLKGNYGQASSAPVVTIPKPTTASLPTAPNTSIYLGNYTIDDLETGTQTTVSLSGNTRSIDTNSLPNHNTGTFPGPGNPNPISAQSTPYNFPITPTTSNTPGEVRHPGVAINGIPFAPGTAERVTCESGEEYRLEGFQELMSLGIDQNNAHVQPTGLYHYHGKPKDLVAFADTGDDLVHIGFARDGHLMYYSKSGAYQPSYQLSSTLRTGTDCVISGPRNTPTEINGTKPNGMLTEDWQYQADSGYLDECNGGLINGQYGYVVTDTFPYVSRCLKGAFEEASRGGGRR